MHLTNFSIAKTVQVSTLSRLSLNFSFYQHCKT